MKQYLNLLKNVLSYGELREDRTGVGTKSLFGPQLEFDLQEGFPAVTTKKLFFKGVVHELLFFLSGSTNNKSLVDEGVNIWTPWSDHNGNLGPIYSHAWRNFGGTIKNVPQPEPKLPLPFKPTVLGIANGITDRSDPYAVNLKSTWRNMLSRCYDPRHDKYAYYGGKGVSVCDRWLVFYNFQRDARKLEGWEEKAAPGSNWGEYQLDKDIKGTGFIYSLESCVWVSRKDNQRTRYAFKRYTIKHDSTGEVEEFSCAIDISRKYNLSPGNFSSMLRGERSTCGGWRLMSSQDFSKGVDQISRLIESLKNNPCSRRHFMTAWNPSDITFQSLPPCHISSQFYVRQGKLLDCKMYQRSADLFLGVPFNIASYALLTHMIAQVTGLNPGRLIITFGDAHIYKNHFAQVKEQIAREPYLLPKLEMRHDITDIDKFEPDHFRLYEYKYHPKIEASIAV